MFPRLPRGFSCVTLPQLLALSGLQGAQLWEGSDQPSTGTERRLEVGLARLGQALAPTDTLQKTHSLGSSKADSGELSSFLQPSFQAPKASRSQVIPSSLSPSQAPFRDRGFRERFLIPGGSIFIWNASSCAASDGCLWSCGEVRGQQDRAINSSGQRGRSAPWAGS